MNAHRCGPKKDENFHKPKILVLYMMDHKCISSTYTII